MTRAPATAGPPRTQAQATLTVDLAALAANWTLLRDRSAPAECAAVVKADAYGVGIEPAVAALSKAGCRTFFVAHLHEGVRVRAALGGAEGCSVYALNGTLPDASAFAEFAAHDVRPVLGSPAQLALWLEHVRGGGRLQAALQFNTGMNRLGIEAGEAREVRAAIQQAGALGRVALVMSHFVSSEAADDPINAAQIDAFAPIRDLFAGVRASLANSSGVFLPQRPHGDLVRPGYALYGGNPTPGEKNPMRPVVHLHAPILQLRDVQAGASAGYNAQWTARRPSRLATIGVGYADGIPRAAADAPGKPGAQAVAGETLCPIVGRVSMDLIVIDVTDAPESALAPGATVELLGHRIGVDDLAARAGTIGYEILTSLGPRYHRVYLD